MQRYGIDIWGEDDFIIDHDKVRVNHLSSPALYDIVEEIRSKGTKGPLLLRFPHLIQKQIDAVFNTFHEAFEVLQYQGDFKAVFPLKVNQYPDFLKPLIDAGASYNYGLEAGSKAELIIAMSHIQSSAPITVNGFKDKEMIELGFLSAKMGHDITLTIEGINELESIIEVANEMKAPVPKIGIRIKLHSIGSGIWQKSGGINSKFGLTSTELLEAMELLKQNNFLDRFTMIHFHIGSQMTQISNLKKALREAGNIYADLLRMGASSLQSINLGGGLGIEYTQNEAYPEVTYSLKEYASDTTFVLQGIAKAKNVKEPNIIIESGRFIAASHAVLVAPVFELFTEEYSEKALRLKSENPPLIEELHELYTCIKPDTALEYLHDSIDHLNSLLTLFDLGYIDLIDRSNSEILTHLIIRKAILMLHDKPVKELRQIQDKIQEKYLVNFSIFQSIPDFWGLAQRFPVMPLAKLDTRPTRSASLWDITCDSDGEIDFDSKNPLFLHSVDLDKEDYFLGFFKVGAYQEVLGMKHNLFTRPTVVTVKITKEGYRLTELVKSDSLMKILEDLNYNPVTIQEKFLANIQKSSFITPSEHKRVYAKIVTILEENGYLKTFN
ncbi:MAG: arginine decarboxylase [Sulfurospirillum sp.]|nr:MAG: arginine decarboxylase [Sulfurospirillum sp.]